MARQSIKYIYADIKFTIKEQCGHWYLDFYLPDGTRSRGTTKLKATEANLQVIKKTIIPDIILGLGKEPPIIEEPKEWVLDAFAKEFFELQTTQIRSHTLHNNILHYNKHILPYFGYKLLNAITPFDLEKWQNKLLLTYKYLTVQRYRSILYSMFEKAYINDIITKNPLEKVNAPKRLQNAFQEEESQDPFTQDEINLIMSYATGYMANFIKIMLSTGMRPGEIIALKWSDIDFNRKIISVTKTRLRSPKKNKVVIDGPVKTNAGKRGIDLFPTTEQAFIKQKELTGWQEYIFLNPSKRPFYNHDVIGVNFKNLLLKSGVKVRVMYNLRHTFASQLISNGADIVYVSKTLGHKDVSITLKIYTKFIKEEDAVRLEKMTKIDKFMVKFENDD